MYDVLNRNFNEQRNEIKDLKLHQEKKKYQTLYTVLTGRHCKTRVSCLLANNAPAEILVPPWFSLIFPHFPTEKKNRPSIFIGFPHRILVSAKMGIG